MGGRIVAGMTRRSGGKTNSAQIAQQHQILPVSSFKGNVENPRHRTSLSDPQTSGNRQQLVRHPVTQTANTPVIVLPPLHRFRTGFPECGNQRYRQSPAAKTMLLTSAIMERRNPAENPPVHIKCTDSFGRMEFVSRYGQKITPQRPHIRHNMTGPLYGIAVEQCSGIMSGIGSLPYRLNHAGLVVGVHQGNERNIRHIPQNPRNSLRGNTAVAPGFNFMYMGSHRLHRIQHGRMFDCGSQNRFSGGTADGMVVRLGSAGSKNNFPGIASEKSGDLFPCP